MLNGNKLLPEKASTTRGNKKERARVTAIKQIVGEIREYYRDHYRLLAAYEDRLYLLKGQSNFDLEVEFTDKKLRRLKAALDISRSKHKGIRNKQRRAKRDLPARQEVEYQRLMYNPIMDASRKAQREAAAGYKTR